LATLVYLARSSGTPLLATSAPSLATGEATRSAMSAPSGSTQESAGTFFLSGSDVESLPVAVPAPPLDRPHTRLQSGVSKPKKFTDDTI
jgi:hypothetical protein